MDKYWRYCGNVYYMSNTNYFNRSYEATIFLNLLDIDNLGGNGKDPKNLSKKNVERMLT